MCVYVDQPATIVLRGEVVWVKLAETGDTGVNTVLEFVMPRSVFIKSLGNAFAVKGDIDKQNAEAAIAMLPKRQARRR